MKKIMTLILSIGCILFTSSSLTITVPSELPSSEITLIPLDDLCEYDLKKE